MRFAIFGDIHSNLHALEAVLQDAGQQSCTHYACLGDIVGYNAYPKECLDRVRAMDCPVVKGNHDEQASISNIRGGFNALAEEAIQYSRQQLNDEDKNWLRSLRLQRQVRDFTIVHATLDTPHKWAYVFNQLDAASSFSYQFTSVCFIGHTHTPRAYIRDGNVTASSIDVLAVQPGKKYLINIGSVGQPRDGNEQAAYCIYDTDANEISLRRIDYDIPGAQEAIRKAGLPDRLAERLARGR
ncbi:MAG: metallophosphoesterase family protein [Chthoniobacterales bacterium]